MQTADLEALPFPIAAAQRLYLTESQPATALYRAFDVVEAALRFSAYAAAALLPAERWESEVDLWFDRPVALGTVLAHLRELLQEPGTLGAVFPTGPRSKSLRLFEELVAARNRTRGHGISLPDSRLREAAAEVRPKVQELLDQLAGLAELRPLVVKGLNEFDGRAHEHQVLVATGDHPCFSVQELRTSGSLPFHAVFLAAPGRELATLAPFLVFEPCPRCEERHLFLLQSAQSGRAQYSYALRGCTWTAPVEEVRARAREIAAAAGGAPLSGGGAAAGSMATGVLVGGRFEIVRELGRGAGGVVFEANDRTVGGPVALKVLPLVPGPGSDRPGSSPASLARRFQREAQVIARLDHPNVVRILDVGTDRGQPYFAMELLPGGTLAERLEKGPLPLDEVVALGRDLLGALGAAAAEGIVHRDVKPSNVLFDADGRLRLTDFGVARLHGATTLTADGELVGTAGYMAPEQAAGEGEIDSRADLFAVGVLLYEAATGRNPFRKASFRESLGAVLNTMPPPPSSLRSELPGWFDEAVQALLAKSPAGRPRGPEEALALLGPRNGASSRAKSRLRLAWRRVPVILPEPEHPTPVDCRALDLRFGWRNQVLRGLDLTIQRGRRVCLLGRNGTGKTTLMRCLTGEHAPDRGTVRLFGFSGERRERVNALLGYIPETPIAPAILSVSDYLNLLARLYPKWDRAYAFALLSRFDLDPRARIGTLSRGQKTMVSILAALGPRPRLLLLDDPTLGLDAFWVEAFMSTLEEATTQHGATALFSTHNFELATRFADRFAFLHGGRIVLELEASAMTSRFAEVVVTLPSDEEPAAFPDEWTLLERKGRTLHGVIDTGKRGPAETLATLQPAHLEVRPASLRSIFYRVAGTRTEQSTS